MDFEQLIIWPSKRIARRLCDLPAAGESSHSQGRSTRAAARPPAGALSGQFGTRADSRRHK